MNSEDIHFAVGDEVVYPAHGVGVITSEDRQKVGAIDFPVYVVDFSAGDVVVRIPKSTAVRSGLRHVCSEDELSNAMQILAKPSKIHKGMWGKKSKECNKKVNSGSVKEIAEVLRDLHRSEDEDYRKSYSEKQIYDSAFSRFVEEYSVVLQIDHETAVLRVMSVLDYRVCESES